MDFFGIYVSGDLLQTFVNMFVVIFSLDFITGIVYILKGLVK